MSSTTKFYDRVYTALSHDILPRFSVRFAWTPPSPSSGKEPICTSSLAKYFADLGYDIKLVRTVWKVETQYGLRMPLFGPQTPEPAFVDGAEKFYATEHELIEYMGMLALSCDMAPNEYLSSWKFTGHTMEVGSAVVVRLKGMFTSDFMKTLFKQLR